MPGRPYQRASDRCTIMGENNSPASIDQDARDTTQRRGICAGIVCTWTLSVVNGVQDAIDPIKFNDFFTNIFRFQGAYLQAMAIDKGINPRTQLEEIVRLMNNRRTRSENAKLIGNEVKGGIVNSSIIVLADIENEVDSRGDNWVSYYSLYGHAVGVARKGQTYYIMDPNFGLYTYNDKTALIEDLRSFISDRQLKKSETANSPFVLVYIGV